MRCVFVRHHFYHFCTEPVLCTCYLIRLIIYCDGLGTLINQPFACISFFFVSVCVVLSIFRHWSLSWWKTLDFVSDKYRDISTRKPARTRFPRLLWPSCQKIYLAVPTWHLKRLCVCVCVCDLFDSWSMPCHSSLPI